MFNKLSFTKKVILAYLAIIALIAAGLIYLYFHDFRVVIPNQVYRSNELSRAEFISVIRHYDIRSVVNLRGKQHAKSNWYRHEMQAMRITHVHHYDIPVKSESLPSVKQLKSLVNILESAPRPMLVHCASGVDRSGLAAAIVLILANAPMAKVEKQISLRYFVIKKDSVGRLVVGRYQQWLRENHLQTSKMNFLTWLSKLQEGEARD